MSTLFNSETMPYKSLSTSFNVNVKFKKKDKRKLSKVARSRIKTATSSRRMYSKYSRLENKEDKILYLKREIDNLVNENKALRIKNVKHEKELLNMDSNEINFQKLNEHCQAEILITKDQLNKTNLSLKQEQNLLKESCSETVKLKLLLSKSREIISKNGLLEKFELKNQLNDSLKKIESTKNMIEVMQSKLDYLRRNYKTELSNCHKLSKSYFKKMKELQSQINILNISFREKEKLLEIQNVYSNRLRLPKLNKRLEDSSLFLTCSSNWKDQNKKNHLSLKDIRPSDFDNCQVNNDYNNIESDKEYSCKDKVRNSEYIRYRIHDEIRKIIAENMLVGRYSFSDYISEENLDKPWFSVRPLKVDKQIESPYIKDKSFEVEKLILRHAIGSNIISSVNNEKFLAINEKTRISFDKVIPNITNSNTEMIYLNNFTNVSTENKTISDISISPENKPEFKSRLKYMYPNNDLGMYSSDILDDLETINPFNHINTTYDKDKKNMSSFPKTINGRCTSLRIKYRLPKVIIEDIKERETIADKIILEPNTRNFIQSKEQGM